MSQKLRRERTAIQVKSKWRLAGYTLAGMLSVVLVLGTIGLLLIFHTTPPPVIHTDPVAAQRLQEELQKAQTAAESGTPEIVGADETELNSLLKKYFQSSKIEPSANNVAVVRDMKLNLTADRMRLYVLANLRGRDITLVLVGKLNTANGYLDFEPISGKIGSLPIPRASLKRAIEQAFAVPGDQAFLRLPRNVRDLRIENGKLVVVFR
ncbi:MAG: hypothetical protein ACRD3Q_19280 [Terriglobales bacterium]